MNSQISEYLYKEVMAFAGFGMYIIDMEGTIIYMDKKAFCIFGLNDLYPDPNSITGKNIAALTVSESPLANLFEKIKKNEEIQGFEYSFATQPDQIKHTENYICQDQNKNFTGLVRETAEKNASFLSDKFHDAMNNEMNSFLYSVSHDMRAPVRSIDGFSSAMLEDYGNILDEVGKDFLNRIHNACKKLDQYIDALLNMSRETKGNIFIEKVDLSRISEEIIKKLRESNPYRKAEIVIQDNIIVMADRRLAKILLHKIFENSWKFTSSNDLALIEFGTADKDGKKVCFIKDNGAGFDMKYAKPRLFGMFQRMHGERFDGIGAGLATARRIINLHSGEIWAESEAEKGTAVYFSFTPYTYICKH